MKNKTAIVLIFLLIFSHQLLAQENAKVIVSNTDNSEIWVKWYSEFIYFDSPVFLYRQENGRSTWEFIGEFSRGNGMSREILQEDKILEVLQNSVMGSRAGDLDGMTLLILMIKSVEHPELCQFLGIQHIDKTVTAGKQYRYKICKGNSPEANSLAISDYITSTKYEKVDPPADIKAWQDNYSAKFSWRPNPDAFMGVKMYRASDNEDMELITPVPIIHNLDENGNYQEALFTDDSLVLGKEYRYIVKSIDYFGRESKPSSEIIVKIGDVTPPLPPHRLGVSVIGKQVQVYWENENISDLAGYRIYRALEGNTDYIAVNSSLIPKEIQTYYDTVSTIGLYNYKVATVDTAGNEALSIAYLADIKDVFPPAAPQNLKASSDTGIIHLSWDICPEPDLMGYYIYRSMNGNPQTYMLLNADHYTQNNFSDKLPKQISSNFSYKVVAVDSSYNKSEFSNTAFTKLPDVTAPEKPVIKTITKNNNTLIIEWYPVYDNDLLGYNIFRFTENQSPDQAEKINIDIVTGITIFTDRFADFDTSYRYLVIAVDKQGNFSAPSEAYTAPRLAYPDANLSFDKFRLIHKNNKKQVIIEWKINKPEETKAYVVYRKSESQKHFTPLSGMLTESSYQDMMKNENGTYQYRVGALGKDDKMYYSEPQEIIILKK